jgi:hypothetical protein
MLKHQEFMLRPALLALAIGCGTPSDGLENPSNDDGLPAEGEPTDGTGDCGSDTDVQFRSLEQHDGTIGNAEGYGDSFLELTDGGDLPPLTRGENGDLRLDLYYRVSNPIVRIERTVTLERDGVALAYVWHDMIDQRDEVDLYDSCYFTNHVGGRLRSADDTEAVDATALAAAPIDLVMEVVSESDGTSELYVLQNLSVTIVE